MRERASWNIPYPKLTAPKSLLSVSLLINSIGDSSDAGLVEGSGGEAATACPLTINRR